MTPQLFRFSGNEFRHFFREEELRSCHTSHTTGFGEHAIQIVGAFDEGLRDAKAGRTVPMEKVRKLLPQWNYRLLNALNGKWPLDCLHDARLVGRGFVSHRVGMVRH